MFKALPSLTKNLLFTIGGLLLFGIFLMYDATLIYSQSVYGNPFGFLILHVGWVMLGIIGFVIMFKIDFYSLEKIHKNAFYIVSFFLLVLAFASFFPCDSSALPFVLCAKGAYRWILINPAPLFPQIPLLGTLSFQPSELAKLGLVLFLSFRLPVMIKKGNYSAFKLYIYTVGFISGLILMQPKMATSLLIIIIGTAMYFVSGADIKPLLFLTPILGILVLLFIFLSPYRRARLSTFLHSSPDSVSLESSGYQLYQVKLALGSGGLLGRGLGKSRQKYAYLPEISSDSIFAVIGEEFGLIGTTLLLMAFGYFAYLGLSIARLSPDMPSKLYATGITFWIVTQFLIHVSANVGLIPYTGVTIPLISYGGSSLVFSMLGLGVLANISTLRSSNGGARVRLKRNRTRLSKRNNLR